MTIILVLLISSGAFTISSPVMAQSRGGLNSCLATHLPKMRLDKPVAALMTDGTQSQGRLVSISIKQRSLLLSSWDNSDSSTTRVMFDDLERVSFHVRSGIKKNVWIPIGLVGGALLGGFLGHEVDSDSSGGSTGTIVGAVAMGGIGLVIGLAVGDARATQEVECRR